MYKQGPTATNYSVSSNQRLLTCRSQIQTVFTELATNGWNITVFCGRRDQEAQTKAFRDGNSNAIWPQSKHNAVPPELSSAIDAGPYIPGVGVPGYGAAPDDDAAWVIFAGAVMLKAQKFGYTWRWGGLFTGLKDLGHFEIIGE